MRFSTIFVVAAAVAVQAANITVTVGAGGLVFTPPSITAKVDDIVNFEFQGKNHSVTQSTFANPCAPMMVDGQMGVNSGFMPLGATPPTVKPVWSIQIKNASTPLWFYCAQTGHCQMGMVAAINAPTTGPKTFDAYKALAMQGAGAATPSGTGSAASSPPPPAPENSTAQSSTANTSTNGAVSQLALGTGTVAATVIGIAATLLL